MLESRCGFHTLSQCESLLVVFRVKTQHEAIRLSAVERRERLFDGSDRCHRDSFAALSNYEPPPLDGIAVEDQELSHPPIR